MVESLVRWLPDHQDETVAVLVPRNQRGFEVINRVKDKRGVDCVELLRSTRVDPQDGRRSGQHRQLSGRSRLIQKSWRRSTGLAAGRP